MRKFNLVKSLTRVMNNSKGLLILCLSLATFGVNEARGENCYKQTIPSISTYKQSGTKHYFSTADNSVITLDNTLGTVQSFTYTATEDANGAQGIDFQIIYKKKGGTWTTIGGIHKIERSGSFITGYKAGTHTETMDVSSYFDLKDATEIGVRFTSHASSKETYSNSRTFSFTGSVTYAQYFTSLSDGKTLEFSDTEVKTTGESKSFTFTYNGTVTSYTWTNSNPTDFTLSAPSFSSDCDNTQTVSVQFTPQTKGPCSGTITGTDNNGNKIVVNVTGNSYGKADPSFTPKNFNATGTNARTVYDELTLVVNNVSDGLSGGDFTASYDASYFSVTRDGNTITIKPLQYFADAKSVTFTQKDNTSFSGAAVTYNFTAARKAPTIIWTPASGSLSWNGNMEASATSNSNGTLSYEVQTPTLGKYEVGKVYVYNANGTFTVRASTTQTDQYAAGYEDLNVTISKLDDHVPFTISKAMYDALNDGTSGVQSWDGGIKLGDWTDGFNWDDKYREFGPFKGIPDKLSCSYSGGSSGKLYQVYQSTDGSSWGEPIINTETEGSANNIQLAPTTRYLKFVYSGNFAGTFSDIKVTELRTFSTDKTSLDFGSNKKDVACIAQTFTFNYANVGHKVSLTTNDPQFIVEPSLITNIGGEQYGSQTITVKYKTDKVHTASNAKLTIADELGHSKEITLKGSTTKKIQTITWNAPYNVAEPAIPIGKTITGAASASSQQGVTYKTSDPTIIEIVDDGKAFKAIAEGPATITAIQVGTEDWEADSISKTFKGTNKIIQVISWNQNFTRLLTTYGSQDLTAVVNLEDAQTGEQIYNKERSDLITYTSQNSEVVSVSGSTLTIVGVGETTLTATAPGDDLYESATVTIPVKVRVPSAGCEDVMLGSDFGPDEYEFYHFSATEDMEKIVKIDRSTPAIPGVLSFQHKGKKWASIFFSGSIDVYESTNNGSSWTLLGSITPTEGTYNTQTYPLSRNATHIKFFRGKSATGYHYINNVEISPAQFIESNANDNVIDFGNVTVNSVEERTVTLSYANVKDNLTITKSSSNITLSCGDIIDLDCGATGTTEIKITFAPEAVGDFSDDIQFLDKKSNKIYTLHITAKIEKSSQHITWEPTQTEYRTIDQIELNATASSLNAVKYYVYEGNDVADFTDGVLTIKKDGKVTIRAYSPADALWAAAADVDKTFTIRKTNLHFDPLPTAATITYPQVLSESALTNGVVKDEDGKVVAGTIAWTNSTAKLNAGENQSQGITFTPSANPAWYNALSSSVSVTVLKATPDATASAGDIVYGAKVKSSVLTNEGSTEGTWTWNDEQNEQVLAVGTYEGLKVHFTPTDQTNYNEIDGTVSLTITAATPTLTWTATPEAAQVHETKTFTASSTNTDNTAAITYSIISGDDCATINASTGEVTVLKAGTITVQASQEGTINFNASEPITTTCTISQAPTTITTNPTVGDVVYGTALNKIELVGGAAQNTVNNQAVEGTFAIISEDIPTAGQHSITVTFTPTNTDMYAPCTKDISVTVLKATPDATASAGEIVYGAKVESSELTNTGTTDGTWTWTDARKNDVLNAGTYDNLQVHFVPENKNYNEADATVSLTVNKAAATLSWTSTPTSADVKDQLTYIATSNHSESAITYAITEGNDCATIDANTGVLTIIKAGTITVQASQAATTNYEAAVLSQTTTLTGEFETVFIGNGDWNDLNNWTHGLPTSSNPDVVISGNMTIDEPISVGSLTIEANGSVTIVVEGDLTVNGKSKEREAYGDLFVHNGGNVTIGSEASVTVHDFVIESSIGTQNGTSQSGQVDNGNNVIYTNGAYIDIHMDPKGSMDDTQWYGFTVPFQVNVQNGVSRKEGETFRKCTYDSDYMIAEYDMNQRLNTGNGWKYIKSGELQPGHFYFFTVNGSYNTYRFKAAKNVITIENQTTLTTNGTGANANWNAVGNTTLTYATISGNDLPNYVQTYINGQSCYQVVYTQEAQFVVGCPFFFQATKNNTTMVLSKPTGTTSAHYAPRQTDRPICVRIAEEGKGFSDQMYITASEDAQGQYQMGRDLAKAGVGTKSAQLWINAYNQQLCVNDAPLVANQAFYDMSLFIPKAGNYEISLPTIPTNGTLYLTQDGYPIWNLNDAPYVLELGKGTISEYGLMFEATQAAAPTDVQTISGNDNAQKILKEQSIYIYKNGNIFNVTGQKVK